MTRVLVVDDCAVDRTLAGEILKRDTGFTVEYARDGEEGLEKIAQSPPDLVLTDLQMPGVDGLQLVSTVRQRHPRVPVILMTSQGSEEIAFRALHLGAASYVPKSLLPDNLRDTVNKVLQAAVDESHYQKTMSCLAQRAALHVAERRLAFHTADRASARGVRGPRLVRRVGSDSDGYGTRRGLCQRHVSRQSGVELFAAGN